MAWILIADDDPLIREVWADALSQAGYRGLSGNEVLQRVRERSDLARIPVLISSGFSDEAPEAGPGLNIVARLQKPQSLTAMLEAVRAALGRRLA